jgi:hypothetical protein
MVLFAAIRERLVVADVPAPFRGNAIALIIGHHQTFADRREQHHHQREADGGGKAVQRRLQERSAVMPSR